MNFSRNILQGQKRVFRRFFTIKKGDFRMIKDKENPALVNIFQGLDVRIENSLESQKIKKLDFLEYVFRD